MKRLMLTCMLGGFVVGACAGNCDDTLPDTIDIPVEARSYRIEPVGSFEGGTAEVAADAVTLEFTNPDGATVRVRYEASDPVWSEQFSR